MTKRSLLRNVVGVISALALLLLFAAWSKFWLKYTDVYDFLKDFSSIFISAAAAYLAYCFQRRQAFLVSLRDLWQEMVEAKGEIVQYTHNPNPLYSDFSAVQKTLSKTIDLVRGVYRNVGETDLDLGFYPLEPLHDMMKSLDKLGFQEVTVQKRVLARSEITKAWNALRHSFLNEFSAPEPTRPITDRGAVDPRRKSFQERGNQT